MKHVAIVAHPHESSFTMSASRTYCEAVEKRGHVVVVRDLYRMGFEPRLHASEIAGPHGITIESDIAAEREILSSADVIAFFYPLWLNSPPAILKGYMERVFGFGFAYGRNAEGNVPMLASRRMISFTSSGAPKEWLTSTGNWDAMRTLFDEHFANVCGLTVVDHVHFGRIVPGMRADAIESHLAAVRLAVDRIF